MADSITGKLITLEGIDGVGKTTQAMLLAGYIGEQGFNINTYREPGGTRLGEELRNLIKAGFARSHISELLLFAAARSELLTTYVIPDLQAGKIVILDRFTDSTLAYQGALMDMEHDALRTVCQLAAHGLVPDLTLWMDMPMEKSLARLLPASAAVTPSGETEVHENPVDWIEQRDIEYFRRVIENYAQLHKNEPARVHRVDAEGDIDDVQQRINKVVDKKLAEWGNG